MLDFYVIQAGDSLEELANRFKVSLDDLCQINNINYPNDVRVGTQILIPQNKEKYFNIYTIEKGDTLYGIGRKYNINPKLLAAMNGLNLDDYIYPNQEIIIPKNGYSYYLTASGDTLDNVASMFKVNKQKLINENETIYLMPDQLLINKK